MKKFISTFLLLTLAIFFLAFTNSDDKKPHKYTGTKTCKMCHKKEAVGQQFPIWEKSKHAGAYKTLQSKDADKIAAEKGFKTAAVETPECLVCHATVVDASLMDKNYKVEQGVQCETCHGAGKDYKSKKVMKDHEKSVANGLIAFGSDKEIEKLCVTCHNDKSPTYKKFDFAKSWAEIIHNTPKKEG